MSSAKKPKSSSKVPDNPSLVDAQERKKTSKVMAPEVKEIDITDENDSLDLGESNESNEYSVYLESI